MCVWFWGELLALYFGVTALKRDGVCLILGWFWGVLLAHKRDGVCLILWWASGTDFGVASGSQTGRCVSDFGMSCRLTNGTVCVWFWGELPDHKGTVCVWFWGELLAHKRDGVCLILRGELLAHKRDGVCLILGWAVGSQTGRCVSDFGVSCRLFCSPVAMIHIRQPLPSFPAMLIVWMCAWLITHVFVVTLSPLFCPTSVSRCHAHLPCATSCPYPMSLSRAPLVCSFAVPLCGLREDLPRHETDQRRCQGAGYHVPEPTVSRELWRYNGCLTTSLASPCSHLFLLSLGSTAWTTMHCRMTSRPLVVIEVIMGIYIYMCVL